MNELQDVVIVGAGGFGLEILQYAADAQEEGWAYRVVGFLDDGVGVGTEISDGLRVLGTTDDEHYLQGNVVIAIGDAEIRARVAAKVDRAGGRLVTLVHPTAYIAPSAQIGPGALLCPFTLVGVRARIGANVAINVYASVGHESVVGSDTVLSPYSAVLGRVRVGQQCYLASQVTVAPGVEIADYSKASVGAFVARDAPAGSLLVGNPAKGRVMFEVPKA